MPFSCPLMLLLSLPSLPPFVTAIVIPSVTLDHHAFFVPPNVAPSSPFLALSCHCNCHPFYYPFCLWGVDHHVRHPKDILIGHIALLPLPSCPPFCCPEDLFLIGLLLHSPSRLISHLRLMPGSISGGARLIQLSLCLVPYELTGTFISTINIQTPIIVWSSRRSLPFWACKGFWKLGIKIGFQAYKNCLFVVTVWKKK